MPELTWAEIERHARTLAPVEAYGADWQGLAFPAGVRVRIQPLTIGGHAYLGAVTGGCPARRMSLASVIAWNSRLPPGCTVVLEGGCLWLRFLVPKARVTLAYVEELLTFMVREGGQLAPDMPAQIGTDVFEGFAD